MTPTSQTAIEQLFKSILTHIEPESHERQGLQETPKRVARAFAEYFSGYGKDGQELLGKTFEDDVLSTYKGAVIVGPVPFFSCCEHHVAVFHGTAYVGYIPGEPAWSCKANGIASPTIISGQKPEIGSSIYGGVPVAPGTLGGITAVTEIPGKVVGLSKLGKLIEVYARRLQVQERLTQQVADDLERYLQPKGCMVVMNAVHTCMCARGAKIHGCSTTTSSVSGVFETKPEARAEFLQLIQIFKP